MKNQISFIAVRLFAATTVLGFATVGPLPALNHEAAPVLVAAAADTGVAPRVYCYNAIKGEPGRLYRGWACQPEPTPALTN